MRDPNASGRCLQLGALLVALVTQGCGNDSVTGGQGVGGRVDVCSIPTDQIFSGALKDAIPALTDPPTAAADSPEASLWADSDRVVGMVLEGQAIAVPLNIFWWHEIVNLNLNNHLLVVTHCPLTGSSLAFNRFGLGVEEFGVSGLLFQNNLVMYDRRVGDEDDLGESLWPQMSRGARCGPRSGTDFASMPALEITWGGWKQLYPSTIVVTPDTGFNRTYDTFANPYLAYQVENEPAMLFPMPGPIDQRRPPKERALGVPAGTGGIAFPFGLLEDLGAAAAIHGIAGGDDFVVLWDTNKQAAMAYRPMLDGQSMTFTVNGGRIEDVETGSEWDISGTAISGSMAGRNLEPVDEAFVAFWFAWLPFYPDLELWAP